MAGLGKITVWLEFLTSLSTDETLALLALLTFADPLLSMFLPLMDSTSH
ncbi:hypothetical protein I6F15_27215 [Bradyrhizobium sp. BRP14]|nr:hypothetical protein [Bradyrhizobium sp. BRP14]